MIRNSNRFGMLRDEKFKKNDYINLDRMVEWAMEIKAFETSMD